jgi:VWFA-related protein
MRAASFAFIFLCGTLCTHRMFSQDAPLSISVDTHHVPVEFTVTDSTGKPITDLTQSDFEALDNGEPRPIQSFSPVETPYNMVLLLDCSGSAQDRRVMMLSAMSQFSAHLRRQDQAASVAFGTGVHLLRDWDGKENRLTTADASTCNGTNLYGALDWAEKKLRGVAGRHGVMVFTDGRESDVARKEVLDGGVKVRRVVPPEEDREFQKVLKAARESGAAYYFVAVDTDLNPGKEYGGPIPDLQQFRARMEQLAHDTGGSVVLPKTSADVLPLILEIGNELGVSYSLDFAPTKNNDKTPHKHKIEIRVRGENNFHVHQSRDFYIAN